MTTELFNREPQWARGFSGFLNHEEHMPTRQIICLLMSSAVAIIASAVLLALPVNGALEASPTIHESITSTSIGPDGIVVLKTTMNVIEDWRLRLYCIIGALGGAWLSVGFFPPPKDGIRPFALKFSCSAIASILFSPAIMQYFKMPLEPDNVLASSGIFGLMAWALIQIAVPLFIKIFAKKASDIGGIDTKP